MVNGVVNGINTVIDALNSLSFDIPDWVPLFGGKSWHMSIPKMNTVSLPRLYTGAFVKANTPQVAVIGDNKTQGEYVLPEDKLANFGNTLLKDFKAQEGTSQDRSDVIQVILNFEGDLAQLARILKPALDSESKRKGVQLITGGVT